MASRLAARARQVAALAIALLLAGLCLLSVDSRFAGTSAAEAAVLAREAERWLVWLTIGTVVALLVSALWGKRVDGIFEKALARVARVTDRTVAWGAGLLFLIAALVLSRYLFAGNPHHVDSIAQLFQGRIFLSGGLTAPAPERFEFFGATHLLVSAGRWFSQYPPGHPALLAVGLGLGAPWLINPVFAAATAVLVFAVGRQMLGPAEARLALVLLVISPFALFMSASFMNHVTTLFFLTLALYAALRATEGERQLRWSAALGLALSAAATIRPLDAAAWALVLGVWLLLRRGWRPAAVAGAVCLLGLVPLLAYNGLTTGNPLRFGYSLLWGPGHGLGFHTDPWGQPFTPLKSLALTALDFRRLNVGLFAWPFPSVIVLALALALAGSDRRLNRFWPPVAALLLAVPLAYFFYWHRDGYLGPRFLYPSLVPAVLLTAAGICSLDARLGRWRPALRLMLAAGLASALAMELPARTGYLSGLEPELKFHPEVLARDAGIRQGIVFVKTGWGNRLVARLWGWGISAPEVERTYRVVDGCRLQGALDRADSAAAAGVDSAVVRDTLRVQLAVWRGLGLPVVRGLLPDASVRVDTTVALDRRCAAEVRADASGFTHYGPLVWRNDPGLRHGVIYSRMLEPPRNRELLASYPGWDSFLYAPQSRERGTRPQLRRLDPRQWEAPAAESDKRGSP